MPGQAQKTMRSDGARNRTRLLSAARTVFAEQGHDAPLDEVARLAEVSRTTLYRHFATREDLAMTVFEDNVSRIESYAKELRGRDDGIVLLVDAILTEQQENRSFAEILSGADVGWFTVLSDRTSAAVRPLLEQGRRTGVVHSDVTLDDVMTAFAMASGAIADGQTAGRDPALPRVRHLLHRALFIMQP
ncbi:TetR/AcrR family transcriptional regulator [Streptomyces sp. NPDC090493]|uniref:TetR/AcrR family transcriptional regulator n=1 Tax=Streptomyces sp. NPDC090493 TaxID=3365964 RepID=UPI0037FE95A1